MQYEALIRVSGAQYYEETQSDVTEKSEYRGTLESLPEGWRVCYAEDPAGDMAGTETELFVTEGSVTLTRRGALVSEMVFSQQKPHKSLYETPYGVLTMEILTESVHTKLTERGGVINLGYAIVADGRALSKNKLRIQVKLMK